MSQSVRYRARRGEDQPNNNDFGGGGEGGAGDFAELRKKGGWLETGSEFWGRHNAVLKNKKSVPEMDELVMGDRAAVEYGEGRIEEEQITVCEPSTFIFEAVGVVEGSVFALLFHPDRTRAFSDFCERAHIAAFVQICMVVSLVAYSLALFNVSTELTSYLSLLGLLYPIYVLLWCDVRLLRHTLYQFEAWIPIVAHAFAGYLLADMFQGDHRVMIIPGYCMNGFAAIIDDAASHNNFIDSLSSRRLKVTRTANFTVLVSFFLLAMGGVQFGFLGDSLVSRELLTSTAYPVTTGSVFIFCEMMMVTIILKILFYTATKPGVLVISKAPIVRILARKKDYDEGALERNVRISTDIYRTTRVSASDKSKNIENKPGKFEKIIMIQPTHYRVAGIGERRGTVLAGICGLRMAGRYDNISIKFQLSKVFFLLFFVSAFFYSFAFMGVLPKVWSYASLMGILTPLHCFLWYDRRIIYSLVRQFECLVPLVAAIVGSIMIGFIFGGDERTALAVMFFVNRVSSIFDDAGNHHNSVPNVRESLKDGKSTFQLMALVGFSVGLICDAYIFIGTLSGKCPDLHTRSFLKTALTEYNAVTLFLSCHLLLTFVTIRVAWCNWVRPITFVTSKCHVKRRIMKVWPDRRSGMVDHVRHGILKIRRQFCWCTNTTIRISSPVAPFRPQNIHRPTRVHGYRASACYAEDEVFLASADQAERSSKKVGVTPFESKSYPGSECSKPADHI